MQQLTDFMPPQDYGPLAILLEQVLLSVAKPDTCPEKAAFQIIHLGLVESDAVLFKPVMKQSNQCSRTVLRTRLQQIAEKQ